MTEDDALEAKRARQNAESARFNVEARWPLVRAISSALRIERERNHFSERIRAALEEDR